MDYKTAHTVVSGMIGFAGAGAFLIGSITGDLLMSVAGGFGIVIALNLYALQVN